MSMEITFGMIKPDAVSKRLTGRIIEQIEANGFEVVALKKMIFSKDSAEKFYEVHKERPFYGELVSFITSGPVVSMILKKSNAVADWRKLMGATNPADAELGTVRRMFADSIGENAVHGSDSKENALKEIKIVFPDLSDLCG